MRPLRLVPVLPCRTMLFKIPDPDGTGRVGCRVSVGRLVVRSPRGEGTIKTELIVVEMPDPLRTDE